MTTGYLPSTVDDLTEVRMNFVLLVLSLEDSKNPVRFLFCCRRRHSKRSVLEAVKEEVKGGERVRKSIQGHQQPPEACDSLRHVTDMSILVCT